MPSYLYLLFLLNIQLEGEILNAFYADYCIQFKGEFYKKVTNYPQLKIIAISNGYIFLWEHLKMKHVEEWATC